MTARTLPLASTEFPQLCDFHVSFQEIEMLHEGVEAQVAVHVEEICVYHLAPASEFAHVAKGVAESVEQKDDCEDPM